MGNGKGERREKGGNRGKEGNRGESWVKLLSFN